MERGASHKCPRLDRAAKIIKQLINCIDCAYQTVTGSSIVIAKWNVDQGQRNPWPYWQMHFITINSCEPPTHTFQLPATGNALNRVINQACSDLVCVIVHNTPRLQTHHKTVHSSDNKSTIIYTQVCSASTLCKQYSKYTFRNLFTFESE